MKNETPVGEWGSLGGGVNARFSRIAENRRKTLKIAENRNGQELAGAIGVLLTVTFAGA